MRFPFDREYTLDQLVKIARMYNNAKPAYQSDAFLVLTFKHAHDAFSFVAAHDVNFQRERAFLPNPVTDFTSRCDLVIQK